MINQNKKILTYIILLVLIVSCNSNTNTVKLHDGDLLFLQENSKNNFTKAITDATHSINDYNFSHVGIAYKENDIWYVLEAIKSGVSKTPIKEFLSANEEIDSSGEKHLSPPTVIVGRLKDKYSQCIPSAINRIKKLIGKPYDIYFNAHNDLYYCSELIQQNYLIKGKPVFPYIKMTFKNSESSKIDSFWIEHFNNLHIQIPEGALGSNPGELSKSSKINILGPIKFRDFN